MIRLSTDNYILKSVVTTDDLLKLVQENTLNHSLVMTSTKRSFIGRIESNSFKIISSSWLPYGAFCVVTGKIKANSSTEIRTSLHKAFRVLFFVWIVFVIASAIFIGIQQEFTYTDWLVECLGFIVLVILFRLYLHGLYVWTRNHSIKRLSILLKSTWGKV